MPSASEDNEDVLILQRALFAVFGVPESRWALFGHEHRGRKVRPLQTWGLAGPVLFNRALVDPFNGGPGGVFVTWHLLSKTASDAVVEITDWEGPLAAGGQKVFLRRVNGAWVVVARKTTWIS